MGYGEEKNIVRETGHHQTLQNDAINQIRQEGKPESTGQSYVRFNASACTTGGFSVLLTRSRAKRTNPRTFSERGMPLSVSS